MKRYYSIMRPVSLGTYPTQSGNKVLNIENFEERLFVENIGREAHGYIEYEFPLPENLISEYELVEGGVKNA